jgi:hypothetical protein
MKYLVGIFAHKFILHFSFFIAAACRREAARPKQNIICNIAKKN